MKSHEQFYEFMNRYAIGVISTVGKDKLPHSAIVGFGQTKDLKNIVWYRQFFPQIQKSSS